MRFRLREARHPVCGGAGACGRGAQRGGCPRQPGRPAALQVRPWLAHGRSGTRAEGGQKRDRDRAWSARGRSRGAPTRGHNRVGAPARPRLRPGVQPARAAFLLRAGLRCRGLGWVLRDAARVVLRLARSASMHFRLREARHPVCGGGAAAGGGRSVGGALVSPATPRRSNCAAAWRAHGRVWFRAEGGQEGGRNRLWNARGRSRRAPTRGHDRVGAPARARLRPGVQPARAAFLLRAYSCCRGWGGRCDAARAIKCLRLGDTASMQFRPREARQPVCALAWRLGWGTA